jgi:hypothetical protein
VHRGRTFCHLAIDERKYTTIEVVPLACATCRVPPILAQSPCRHMSFGVEVDEYGGRLTAETCHVACEALVVRLLDLRRCGEGVCEQWEAWEPEEAVERARQAAERDRRRRAEERFGAGHEEPG